MSQKKSREQRKIELETNRPLPKESDEEQLPLPENSTKLYTMTLKDSMLAWRSWQLRPKPLLRRLILVLLVAVVWIAILAQKKPLEERMILYFYSLAAIPMYLLVAALISTFMGFMTYYIKKTQFKDVIMYWDNNRVEWVNEIYSPKHTWGQFKGHHITPRVAILALQGTLITIPIRAFKTTQDLENFSAVAAEKAVGLQLNFLKRN